LEENTNISQELSFILELLGKGSGFEKVDNEAN